MFARTELCPCDIAAVYSNFSDSLRLSGTPKGCRTIGVSMMISPPTVVDGTWCVSKDYPREGIVEPWWQIRISYELTFEGIVPTNTKRKL
jgi:hypothetical protein